MVRKIDTETQSLSSSRHVISLLDMWDNSQKKSYLTAYNNSDWDTVYSMTDNLDGSQYSRNMIRAELADVIAEQIDGKVK
jgi:hypothetical protein